MIDIKNAKHIVQSPEWSNFKNSFGTKSIKVDDIFFTKHKIPFLPFFVGYSPRVNFLSQAFDLKKLKKIAQEEKCITIRFDVPNVLKNNANESSVKSLLGNFFVSPKSTFAKNNVLTDISGTLEQIAEKFNQKGRYNIKLAEKKGVTVSEVNTQTGIKIFYELLKETAKRQNFLPHSYEYYKQAFETLHKSGNASILIASFENEPLTAWMLFYKDSILYYPYGASSTQHKNLMASDLVIWEAIKLGKQKNCTVFDMWGATNDEKSPWWGFTQFKLKFGGELVEYIDSYDFVINHFVYKMFNTAYAAFWAVRKLILRIIKR
jgi:lipid II:glycine glycyltransferase (peptidoglycan interpeptide bridge formation enzyme)